MKVLGIDSSGLVASAALLEEESILGDYSTNYKKTHSETLMPMIDTLLTQLGVERTAIDYVAVASGPGSFTGLRIGAATAKGICLALHVPLIPVPTLDAMAMNLWGAADLVCPMMDARRDQVYTGIYAFSEGRPVRKTEPGPLSLAEAAERLNGFGRKVLLLGDGADRFKEDLKNKLTVDYDFAPAHLNRQRAGSVAVLGRLLALEGGAVSGESFAPSYYRLSQAERERKKRMESEKTEDI